MAAEGPERGGVEFVARRLYRRGASGRQLLRFICWDQSRDELIFKAVNATWQPATAKAIAFDRQKALKSKKAGHIFEVPECIRREYMDWDEERLKAEGKDWYDEAVRQYEGIEALLAPERLARTFSPSSSDQVIREHVEATFGELPEKERRLEAQRLRRTLHRCAWFGLDQRALLGLESDRGKSQTLFVFTKEKRGPADAAEKVYGEEYAARPTRKRDVELVLEALRDIYVGRNGTYQEAYDYMCEHLCLQPTRTPDGQEVVYRINAGEIISPERFYRIAKKLVRAFALNIAKAARADRPDLQTRRGHSADLAPQAGDVFDTDATPFNQEAVAAFQIDGEIPNIGKVTAIIVIDRRSRKFVGWHVYVGHENWSEGYRLALFCALTSKKRHLEWLKIDAPDAFADDENIAPSFIYVDRGPGSSDAAYQAAARLRIDRAKAAPAWAPGKGDVEGAIGMAQNAQAQEPGAYRRTRNARDRDAKRMAKLFAKNTPYVIEQKLVKFLIEENDKPNKEHLLTHEMKMDGVAPTANAIFSWYVRKMGGVEQRLFAESEVYLALLDRQERKRVTVDGVKMFSSYYNSDRLKAYRSLMPGKLYITVMYHPLRPAEAYWLTLDGAIDRLDRDRRGGEANGTMTAQEIELWELRQRASTQVKRRKKKKGVALTKEQARIAKKAAGGALVRQRSTPTQHVVGQARKLQAHRGRKEQPFDHADLNAPQVQQDEAGLESLARSKPPPTRAPAPTVTPRPPATAPAAAPAAAPVAAPADAGVSGRARTSELWRRLRESTGRK